MMNISNYDDLILTISINEKTYVIDHYFGGR